MMLLNIQGVTPSSTSPQRWKLEYLSNLVNQENKSYHVIALTETWLKPKIEDAQVSIPGFNIFRADRVIRERGGALLYINKNIPITKNEVYDDDICEAIFCTSPSTNTMISCVYKPCDASEKSFSGMLHFLDNCIKDTPEVCKYNLIILGDLNFPDLWSTSTPDVVAKSNSEHNLLNFINNHFLSQYINAATRQSNILDLLFTNNDKLVQHLSIEKHELLSDHNVIDIMVPPGELLPAHITSTPPVKSPSNEGFRSLNLFKADFDAIDSYLAKIDWDLLWEESSLEMFPKKLFETVLQACKLYTPIKPPITTTKLSSHDRSYRSLMRKRKKLKHRLNCIKSLNPVSPRIKVVEQEIDDVLQKLKSLTFNKKSEEEIKAINKIKSDPKFFYSYAKKFAKTKQYIPQLFDKNGIIKTGRKEIADQFVSAFSDPNNPTKTLPSSKFPTSLLSDFSFDVKNMINAIDEIDPNSACPDFSIPAKVLKNCKLSLAYPLFLMWKESLSTGVVPQFYKKQLITPILQEGK